MVSLPSIPLWPDQILRYYDEPETVAREMEEHGRVMMETAEVYLSWEPDILMIGNSGLMISNPPPILGNLHTTDIMLRGTREQVETACKKAIDEAGDGGGFILSTGDQTPRDTPEENIRIMQRVAESYGRY